MLDLEVIDDPGVAVAALGPIRAKVLANLRTPGSASTVADSLGLPRQKVNYHLRALEAHGLVRLIEERPRRGLTERIMVASALTYAISPDVLGESAAAPETTDRLSSRYLIAIASRLVRDVAGLARAAARAGKPVATLTIDSEVRFATAADRAAFSLELTNAVADICARHHNETARNGRWHRVIVAAHPRPASAQKGSNHD